MTGRTFFVSISVMNAPSIHPERRHERKVTILVCVIVALLLAVSGGVWWFYAKRHQPLQGSDRVADAITSQPRTEAEDRADALRWEVLQNPSDETVAESSRQLEALFEAAETDEDREAYLLELIAVYRYVNYYDQAIDCTGRLEQLRASALSAGLMADIYFDQANYGEAARYYQLAAERSEVVDDPSKDAPYNDYMVRKREAEALL